MVTAGDEPRVRATDPEPSHLAADRSQKHLSQSQSIVLSIFRARGNFTDSELDTHYELLCRSQGWPVVKFDTPRKRRSQLTARDLIVDSGERRENEYGNPEVVWVLNTGQVTS